MKKRKGFTLIELLVVISIIGILFVIIIPELPRVLLKAKNAFIVSTLKNLNNTLMEAHGFDNYPDVCFDFEEGEKYEHFKKPIEEAGGIWHCHSTNQNYRIFVKLNQSVVISSHHLLNQTAYAQEENMSGVHTFGNYFCINSYGRSQFTHWSGYNIVFPSCSDVDYTEEIQNPMPNPDPTPDPEPETNPEPPVNPPAQPAPGKSFICHFGNTIEVSNNAVNAHISHGDTLGAC